MNLINALILGLVQGLTEFIPVSSSAHIRIVGEWLGTGADPGAAFTAITQLGTESAVLIYFWKDIVRIASRWFGSLLRRIPRLGVDHTISREVLSTLGSHPEQRVGMLHHADRVLEGLQIPRQRPGVSRLSEPPPEPVRGAVIRR